MLQSRAAKTAGVLGTVRVSATVLSRARRVMYAHTASEEQSAPSLALPAPRARDTEGVRATPLASATLALAFRETRATTALRVITERRAQVLAWPTSHARPTGGAALMGSASATNTSRARPVRRVPQTSSGRTARSCASTLSIAAGAGRVALRASACATKGMPEHHVMLALQGIRAIWPMKPSWRDPAALAAAAMAAA